MSAAAITAADSVAIVVGFRPRYVKWQNITSRICCEWYEGMAANTCMKSAAAGTNTIETTNGGITVDAQGFQVIQNATLLAIAASDVINWTAQG